MTLNEFKALEAKLGHAPTQKEVREAEAEKPMFKTANVRFTDNKYDYKTSVNGKLSDTEIIKYFKGQVFNMGNVRDDLQKCIECTVEASDFVTFLN